MYDMVNETILEKTTFSLPLTMLVIGHHESNFLQINIGMTTTISRHCLKQIFCIYWSRK